MKPGIRMKPCPFCGSKDLRISNPDEGHVWVSCNDCQGCGPDDITEQLAIKKWNHRPTEKKGKYGQR